MKKMLILALLLTAVSLTNAAMNLQIYRDGSRQLSSDITIGGHATLSIFADGFADGDGAYFGLVTNNTLGSITGGNEVVPPAPNMTMMVGTEDYAPYFPGIAGSYFNIDTSTNGATAPAGIYIDNIDFSCLGAGDVVVQLWTTDFSENPATLLDSITIHQVPEPATMLLLSLGGLALRRFKK